MNPDRAGANPSLPKRLPFQRVAAGEGGAKRAHLIAAVAEANLGEASRV